MTDKNSWIPDAYGKLKALTIKDEDICFTKPEMAKALIDTIEFEDGDVCMEPCRGKGAFYDAFPSNVVKKYCEISEDIDYLQYNDGMVDYTISNPPFVPSSLFWKFHEKAMETTNKHIFWLVNLDVVRGFTPTRLENMKEKGWYIQKMTVVKDKRWYGRYYFIKFGRVDNGVFDFININF
jgi:hypothetical protein